MGRQSSDTTFIFELYIALGQKSFVFVFIFITVYVENQGEKETERLNCKAVG